MSMLDTCILGGEVLLPDGVAAVDLGIKDGAIAGIYAPGTAPDARETIAWDGAVRNTGCGCRWGDHDL